MTTFHIKEGSATKAYTFNWITDDQASRLLGNPRPDTLAKILESDTYWLQIFQAWCAEKGFGTEYANWIQDPDGDARDALKTAGGRDVRKDFYRDLGTVKFAIRQQQVDSGEAADNLWKEFNMD
jgi:hypothetical protein